MIYFRENSNDEYGSGANLLWWLEHNGIQNRMVFVVRKNNGSHIGTQRFDVIENAVKSTIRSTVSQELMMIHVSNSMFFCHKAGPFN